MCNEQEAALKIPTDECCGVPRTWGQSCFCRSSVHYFVWIVSLSEHYFKHDNMCPLNKTTFTFLLCLVVCINAVQDSEVVENEDKPVEKIRHSRYQKLDQLLKKIHKLDEIRPTEDKDIRTLINKFWTTDLANDTKNETDLVSKSIPREVEDYDDYTFEDLDEPEDSDYDVEIIGEGREEQLGVVHTIEGDSDPAVLSEMVKNYMADRWTTDIDSDFEHPSQDYDEQEWEDGSQSDSNSGTTTPKINWVVHSTGIRKHVPNKPAKQADMNKARDHLYKMTNEGSCKTPIRKVIPIQNVYPNPSKIFIPHCTILYRCGDDAGCCKFDSQTCVPKETNHVHLYFYTNTVGKRGTMIEKLSFLNHTECECVPKRDYMVKDEMSIFSLRSGPSFKNMLNLPEPVTEAPRSLRRCQCPSEFSAVFTDEGDCRCDCHTRQRDCLRIKRGREYFSLKDRQCIINGSCNIPNCEFGTYYVRVGRCPRKHEQNDYNRKY